MRSFPTDPHRAPEKTRLHSDHLKGNPRRVLGVKDDKLIQCEKHAQFYPSTEHCPWCLSWAEEMEERAKRVTVREVEPVKPERSLGQRYYEGLMGPARPWDAISDKAFWQRRGEDVLRVQGAGYFDQAYP